MLLHRLDRKADVVLFDFSIEDESGFSEWKMLPMKDEFYGGEDRHDLLSVCICRRGPEGEDASIGLGAPWSKLYRKSFLIKNGLRFTPGVKMSQDILFNIDVLQAIDKVQYV